MGRTGWDLWSRRGASAMSATTPTICRYSCAGENVNLTFPDRIFTRKIPSHPGFVDDDVLRPRRSIVGIVEETASNQWNSHHRKVARGDIADIAFVLLARRRGMAFNPEADRVAPACQRNHTRVSD